MAHGGRDARPRSVSRMHAGRAPHPSLALALPAILGNGVAGTADGVRVITTTGGLGGYAERAAVPGGGLIEVPEGLALDAAGALLADGRTALGLIGGAPIAAGETVLVEAAAGGVGSLLVQLARNAGARVIAAAGGGRKLALALEVGADEAVDYTRPGWAGRMCPFGLASGAWFKVEPEEAEARGVELVSGRAPDRRGVGGAHARRAGARRRGSPAGRRSGGAARRCGRRACGDRGARDGGEDAAVRVSRWGGRTPEGLSPDTGRK